MIANQLVFKNNARADFQYSNNNKSQQSTETTKVKEKSYH